MKFELDQDELDTMTEITESDRNELAEFFADGADIESILLCLMDRTNVINTMLDQILVCHPGISVNQETLKKVVAAQSLLEEVYQDFGADLYKVLEIGKNNANPERN